MKIYDITLDIEPGMLYWHEGKTPEVMDEPPSKMALRLTLPAG